MDSHNRLENPVNASGNFRIQQPPSSPARSPDYVRPWGGILFYPEENILFFSFGTPRKRRNNDKIVIFIFGKEFRLSAQNFYLTF